MRLDAAAGRGGGGRARGTARTRPGRGRRGASTRSCARTWRRRRACTSSRRAATRAATRWWPSAERGRRTPRAWPASWASARSSCRPPLAPPRRSGFLVAPISFEFVTSLPGVLGELDLGAVNRLLGDLEAQGRALLAEAGVPAADVTVTRACRNAAPGSGPRHHGAAPGRAPPSARTSPPSRPRSSPSTRGSTPTSTPAPSSRRSTGASSPAGRLPRSDVAGQDGVTAGRRRAEGRPAAPTSRKPAASSPRRSTTGTRCARGGPDGPRDRGGARVHDGRAAGRPARGGSAAGTSGSASPGPPRWSPSCPRALDLAQAVARIEADPVGLEIMWSRLINIVEECWLTVWRTAFSLIIGEAQDFACELLDPRGNSLAHSPARDAGLQSHPAPRRCGPSWSGSRPRPSPPATS